MHVYACVGLRDVVICASYCDNYSVGFGERLCPECCLKPWNGRPKFLEQVCSTPDSTDIRKLFTSRCERTCLSYNPNRYYLFQTSWVAHSLRTHPLQGRQIRALRGKTPRPVFKTMRGHFAPSTRLSRCSRRINYPAKPSQII